MGEAKRRGTREQRIAQAIERNKIEDTKREEERIARAAARRKQAAERQRLLTPPERKEAVMLAGAPRHDPRLLMAALAGLAAPALILADPPKRKA